MTGLRAPGALSMIVVYIYMVDILCVCVATHTLRFQCMTVGAQGCLCLRKFCTRAHVCVCLPHIQAKARATHTQNPHRALAQGSEWTYYMCSPFVRAPLMSNVHKIPITRGSLSIVYYYTSGYMRNAVNWVNFYYQPARTETMPWLMTWWMLRPTPKMCVPLSSCHECGTDASTLIADSWFCFVPHVIS